VRRVYLIKGEFISARWK